MKRPRRRTILKLLLLLIAGAALNVAVAWGISQTAGPIVFNQVRVPRFAEHRSSSTGRWWRVTYLDEIGMAHISADRQQAGFNADPAKQIADDELPSWSLFRTSATAERDALPRVWEYARGFPMLSMHLRIENDSATYQYAFVHVIKAPFRQQTAPGHRVKPERYLPVGIIWPGFAINTLFYAGVLWMLFAGPFALRRMMRRRRGQCAWCAYPVGTSAVCTECGAAVLPLPSQGRGPG